MILEHRTDIDWLRLAFQAAAEHSDDPHTQNGAVLAPQSGFVSVAANHVPAGLAITASRMERPRKYGFIEHAERSAIFSAARCGTKTAGSTLYCCWFACRDCARAIICAGVGEVVGHVRPRALTPGRWEDEVLAGEAMLREAGVSMRWLAEPLGVTIKFDGKELTV